MVTETLATTEDSKEIDLVSITTDPGVAGQLWRDGTTLKISLG